MNKELSVFSLSRKDYRFIQYFLDFFSLFGLVPQYDFTNFTNKNQKITKWFGILLCALFSGGTAASIYSRRDTATFKSFVPLTLDIFNEIFLAIMIVSQIYSSTVRNANEWITLNNNFQYIDKMLNNLNERERNWLKNAYVQAFIAIGIPTPFLFISISNWVKFAGFENFRYYFLHHIGVVLYYFINLLMFNVLMALKSRYKDLNELLKGKFQHENELFTIEGKNTIYSIREIGSHYRILSDSISSFNNIFGIPMLFGIGQCIAESLFYLGHVMQSREEFGSDIILLTSFGLVFINLAFTMTVIFTGGEVVGECEMTYPLCHKLQEKLLKSSVEREELLQMANQVKAHSIEINASGFVDINRGTFLTILSAITTWFIVIIQLQ